MTWFLQNQNKSYFGSASYWRKMIGVLMMCCLGASSGLGSEKGLVISLQGQVQLKSSQTQQWQTLKTGTQLVPGDTVKTSTGSSARILNPDGSLLRIPGKTEQVYGTVAKEEGNKNNLKTFFKELTGNRSRKRVAMTRGTGDPEQEEWITLMLEPVKMLDIGELIGKAGAYQAEKSYSRAASVLWKVHLTVPDHEGVRELLKQSMQSYHNSVQWQAQKQVGGKTSPASAGDVLTEGNGVQIHYTASGESYYYLFLTTHPTAGDPTTYLLSPESVTAIETVNQNKYFTARIEGKQSVILPTPSEFYPIDEVRGTEHLWGWSCAGPVSDEKFVKQAISFIESLVRKKVILSKEEVFQTAPGMCSDVWAMSLKHR